MKKNPFFKLEDFHQLEVLIEGKNVTSQLPIPGGSKHIHLVEVTEDGISIDLPPRSCALGHTLSLDISARKLTGTSMVQTASGKMVEEKDYLETHLHILGVIEHMEGDPQTSQQVRLKFRQYAKKEWEELLNYLADKQSNINELLRKTRK